MSDENLDKIGYLQMVDIFQDLTEEEIEEIDRATTITTCRKGRIFYMPEDTSEVLFLLKEGQVQLYRISPDGKKLVIGTVGPGAIFGEMALIGQGMHNTFAEVTEESVICVMSRDDVERLLMTKPLTRRVSRHRLMPRTGPAMESFGRQRTPQRKRTTP